MNARKYAKIDTTRTEISVAPNHKIRNTVIIAVLAFLIGFITYRIIKTSNKFPDPRPVSAVYFTE